MKSSFAGLAVMTLALLVVSATAFAAKQAKEATHDGKVVSLTGHKLVMTSQQGQEHSYTLTADAKLTLDGRACQAADLKPGTRIRVTTQGADKSVANRIEGFDTDLEFASNRHDGKVVSLIGNKLVMTSKEGQEHSHTLTADARLTLDGKACNAADLKPGTRIRVTTQGADKSVANRIEGLDTDLDFASNRHDGRVVSIIGNKLVMTGAQGKEEHTYTLTADVKVTCDGKACKSSDLKPGMRIRVTSERDEPHAAARVEALDKNLDFASL